MLPWAVQLLGDCDFIAFFFFYSNRYKSKLLYHFLLQKLAFILGTVHTPLDLSMFTEESPASSVVNVTSLFRTFIKGRYGGVHLQAAHLLHMGGWAEGSGAQSYIARSCLLNKL